MQTLVTILHVIVCVFLILTVLLQAGKGGGMGAAFGGGTSMGTVFGGSGAGNFLRRLTVAAAIIFMLSSMTLAWMATPSTDPLVEVWAQQNAALEQRRRAHQEAIKGSGGDAKKADTKGAAGDAKAADDEGPQSTLDEAAGTDEAAAEDKGADKAGADTEADKAGADKAGAGTEADKAGADKAGADTEADKAGADKAGADTEADKAGADQPADSESKPAPAQPSDSTP
jgi:preprotein translocase subunit SecG